MSDWKDIPGYEGAYQAHPDGLIRSVQRTIVKKNGAKTNYPSRVLRPWTMKKGYQAVSLSSGNQQRSVLVHRLVAAAHLQDAWFPGAEIRHLDGNPGNNSVKNLAWGTSAENQQDRIAHGNHPGINQTHCKWGHPFDEANTYFAPSAPNKRKCRMCRRNRVRVEEQP